MPNVIISFDMNTKGPKSTQARSAFEAGLVAAGWVNEILVGGRLETLPDTTLVATRTDAQAKGDVATAEAAAKKVEPLFAVTKFIISRYVRIDSRSDVTRPSPGSGTTIGEIMKRAGLR